jgi:SAM-dependent methyltransferase
MDNRSSAGSVGDATGRADGERFIPAATVHWLTPFFDGLVDLYGFGPRRRRQVADLLHLAAGERLLDVGCGSGMLLAATAERYPAAVAAGVDVDPQILGIARRRLDRRRARVPLIRAGAAALPAPGHAFDAVVSTLAFHHLTTDSKRRALAEIRRVLKPGGRFLLVDIGRVDNTLLRAAGRLAGALGLAEAATSADNVDGRIPQLLGEAGFSWREIAPPFRGVRYWEAR